MTTNPEAPTAEGWTIRVYPDPDRPHLLALTAIDADRKRVIRKDRLSAADAAAFDPVADWYTGLVNSGRAPRRA